jgi:uncharacterized protein (UPF0332 family)
MCSLDPKEWKERSSKNLAAAICLIDKALEAPAASRLYYALYQAVIAKAIPLGVGPTSRGGHRVWEHRQVSDLMKRVTGSSQDRMMYRHLVSQRECADYLTGEITLDDVRRDLADARPLLERLGVSHAI